jgi:hypothetical protein
MRVVFLSGAQDALQKLHQSRKHKLFLSTSPQYGSASPWFLFFSFFYQVQSVVGKIFLKISGVTLLPLMVRETSYF